MTTSSAQADPAADSGRVFSPNPSELLRRVLQNTFWLLNSSLLVRALNLLRGVILARLLVPDDFGLFGLASVVIGFTAIFSDVGAGVFLIYRQDKVEDHADTAFWANLGIATALAAGVAATAPLVSRFYGRPDLVPVLCILALSSWLQTVFTIHRNLLRRELRFRPIAVIDALVTLASFGIAVGLAWGGWGVWAFVLSNLLGNAVNALLLCFAAGWYPRWRFSRQSLSALAPFSGWFLGQAIVWYLVLNLDNLLVGKFLGMGELGVYGLAYNYALLPVTLVAGSLGGVVFPELARLLPVPLQFWSSYFQISRLIAGIVCPIAAVLVVATPDLFPVLFGPKWNAAILPFQVLAAYGAVRCVWADPFPALGRFDLSFWLGSAACLLSFLGIYLGLSWGNVGVAWAVLIVGGATQLSALYVATRSPAKLMAGFRNVMPYFVTASIAASFALGVRYLCLSRFREQKVFLALLTGLIIFGVYALVFRTDLRNLVSAAWYSTKRHPDVASLKVS
jgi:PST family polysaccharide transporter